MKKIAYWNNYTNFAGNQAFNPKAYGIGEDLGYPVILLKEKLAEKGYILETLDMDDVNNYESIIFSDYPNPKTCCVDINSIPKEKKYLILEECEMIYSPNKRTDLLKDFHKVFAYNDNLVKNYGYIKLNMPNKIKQSVNKSFSEKKFCTLIAGNKKSKENGELYSSRLKAINWFEKNYPDKFDFYGMGWDTHRFTGPKLIRALNKIPYLNTLMTKKHICYKGKVDKKIEVLSDYKYSICFENSCAIPGYISEKIMDCFFSGCVPVYYGAPNITEYIPENCFIDYRSFSSFDSLFNFLRNISEDDYNLYIQNIKNFLSSKNVYPFSAECFVETILIEVLSIK